MGILLESRYGRYGVRRYENLWHKLISLALALVLIVPLLAACGNGDEENPTPTSNLTVTASPTPEVTVVSTPTSTPVPTQNQLPTPKVGGEAFPALHIGDKWVSRIVSENAEYEWSVEVTDEDVTDGKDCYVLEGSFNPPISGMVDSYTGKMDKSTMDPVMIQLSGSYENMPYIVSQSYSYEIIGEPLYPYAVGKETRKIETLNAAVTMMGETEKTTTTSTFTYKIEQIEEIIVPAGTFRCFKIVKYNEQGGVFFIEWNAEETKFYQVKTLDPETGDVVELVSYSVSK